MFCIVPNYFYFCVVKVMKNEIGNAKCRIWDILKILSAYIE